MALTAEQISMCTRPGAYMSDALEEAGHKTLKHAGVKGMKWNKHKALEDQGQTGDARVNGIEVDKEVINKLNEWIVTEKDPAKVAQIRKQLDLYKLDLKASQKLEKYNQETDPKKKAKMAKELNKISPNILKNNHYDASKDKQTSQGKAETAAEKRVAAREKKAETAKRVATKHAQVVAKRAAKKNERIKKHNEKVEAANKQAKYNEQRSKDLAAEQKAKAADKKLETQIKSGKSKSKRDAEAKKRFEAARKLHK